MQQVIDFLKDLSQNNNKEWFNANRDRYIEAKGEILVLTSKLIEGIRSFDDSIGALSPSSCTYRIFRDTRFSKDKSPYKTQMGIFINRGGKKSGYSGYYFQVSSGLDPYSQCHMAAVGDYWCDPKVLKILREDIDMGHGDFRSKVDAAKGFFLDQSDTLKKVPRGFAEESPEAEFLKLKKYCLCSYVDDDFVNSPSLADNLVELFRPTKPFLDYINRAVEYVQEEASISNH